MSFSPIVLKGSVTFLKWMEMCGLTYGVRGRFFANILCLFSPFEMCNLTEVDREIHYCFQFANYQKQSAQYKTQYIHIVRLKRTEG